MSQVIDLSGRRPPVYYTIRLTHHWDGRVEVFVEDVADDERSRESVGYAIGLAAIAFGAAPIPQADELNRVALARIDKLMSAEKGTPEGDELSALADVVQAYESARYSAKD